MIREQYFLSLPFQFSNKLFIYSPKVNEVVKEENFWQCYKSLTLSQEEIEDELVNQNIDFFPTPLEFLLNNCFHNEQYEFIVKKAFNIFCHTDIFLLYESKKILIGNPKKELKNIDDISKIYFLDESNFFNFQNEIRKCLGEKQIEKPNPDEDPRIKKIKAKARYRDKIKVKKGMGLKLASSLASICCMNMGLNPLNIGEISYASVGTLMEMYGSKEKYESDIEWLQAGADSKKIKPVYWIRNLDD